MFPIDENIIGNNSKRFTDTDIDHLVFVCISDPEDEERKAGLAELGIEMDDCMLREMDEMNSISRDRNELFYIKGQIDIVKKMLEMGLDNDTISKYTGLNTEFIQMIRDDEL